MSILDFSKKGSLDKLFQEWQGGLKTTPGDYVRSLESGLPSCQRNKRWIVVLQAYIDASGMGGVEKQPHLVLAGFLSTSEVWAEFSDAWKAELDKNPALPYFKMNEAFHPNAYDPKNKNPFDGWKESDIRERVFNFLKVIKSYPLGRVNVWLDKREFDRMIIKEIPKSKIDNPYALCFIGLVMHVVASQVKHKMPFPIDFIFDIEGAIGHESVKWFKDLKENHVPREFHPYFGSPPIFRDDKIFLPLQAADAYAWLVRRHLMDNKDKVAPIRPELELLKSIGGLEHKISPEEIAVYMQLEDFFNNLTIIWP